MKKLELTAEEFQRELRPDSSVEERRLIKSEATGSTPVQGSFTILTPLKLEPVGFTWSTKEPAPEPKPWWHYIVLRKELSGGAAMAQACHAAALSANSLMQGTMRDHTRMCVLTASKEEMEAIYFSLSTFSCEIGLTLSKFEESEGELAGVMTAFGFLTSDKEKTKEILAKLRPWRK